MNPVQMAYAEAKARYEVAIDESAERAGEIPGRDATDAEFRTYTDRIIAIEHELGVPQMLVDMMAAEEAMIEWARNKVKNSPKTRRQWAANAEGLDHLFSVYKQHPNIHRKLVEASFRLA